MALICVLIVEMNMTPPTNIKVTTLCKEVWQQQYASKAEYWTVKEASNLKQLVAKIRHSHRAVNNETPTDESIVLSFIMIVENNHKFYKGKTIPMLNMGYNEIIRTLTKKRNLSF